MSEIHDRIEALEAQLAELKATVDAAPAEELENTSRRDMFKKLALGAAGVAAGGALLGKATPAAATDGSPFNLGQTGAVAANQATSLTGVNYLTNDATGACFLFQSGNTWGPGAAAYPAALAGWADAGSGTRHGIYGWTAFANRSAIVGIGSNPQATGALFQGGRAAINVVNNGAVTDALVAAARAGDILATSDGTLWYSPANGEVVPLGGAAAGSALYLLDAPARAYDSRAGAVAPFGPLNAAGSPRTISLATGTAGGATVDAVPNGATGALISLTLDATVGSGFIGVFAADLAAWPGNSNANWYASGQIVAVTTVSKVDATSQIKLQVGGGGSTQIIVDVIGYYA